MVGAISGRTKWSKVQGMPRRRWTLWSALAGLIATGFGPVPVAARVLRDLAASSPALGQPIPYAVALPDAYDSEPTRRFPVLLLLHGTDGSHHDWLDWGGLAEGIADRARFIKEDLFETDLTKATVITSYLLPEMNQKLRPKILNLKPGTRVVAHDYHMGEWSSDENKEIIVPEKKVGVAGRSYVYLWIVPAKIGGRWQAQINAMPTAELIGRLSLLNACAATPPKSARAWDPFQARASTVAGIAAASPKRTSRIGCLGK